MLDDAIQHYWKLVKERSYHVVLWIGVHMHMQRFYSNQWDVIVFLSLGQPVRRLVQQDAVDGIRRVVSLICGGGFFMLEEITSNH